MLQIGLNNFYLISCRDRFNTKLAILFFPGHTFFKRGVNLCYEKIKVDSVMYEKIQEDQQCEKTWCKCGGVIRTPYSAEPRPGPSETGAEG